MHGQASMEGEALVLFLDDKHMVDNAVLADLNSMYLTGALLSQNLIPGNRRWLFFLPSHCFQDEALVIGVELCTRYPEHMMRIGRAMHKLLQTCLFSCCSGPGEVPGLFTPEETAVLEDSQSQADTAAALRSSLAASPTSFWERVRANLHIVLSMNPASPAFCERCRLFPGGLFRFRSPFKQCMISGSRWLIRAQAWLPAPRLTGSQSGQLLPFMRWLCIP